MIESMDSNQLTVKLAGGVMEEETVYAVWYKKPRMECFRLYIKRRGRTVLEAKIISRGERSDHSFTSVDDPVSWLRALVDEFDVVLESGLDIGLVEEK